MLFQEPSSDGQILGRMLAQLNNHDVDEEQVQEWLSARFGQTAAVVVIDMCGFSRTTREHGIVEFLRRMYEVQGVILPIIDQYAGMVLNTLADSLACLFPTVDAALHASAAMIFELDTHNADFPQAPNHYLSIGIGWGRVLVFDRRDAFGDEMNHAGKLGEDMAGRREILLTPAAVAQLHMDLPLHARTFEIGGAPVVAGLVDLDAWGQPT